LETLGIPTVVLTRREFVGVVNNAVSGIGLAPDIAMVTFPTDAFLPDADLAPLEARRREFYDALTQWTSTKVRSKGNRMRGAEGASYESALDRFNEQMLADLCGDGLPLLPPTAERVNWILRGSALPRAHVLGKFPPRGGIVSVEACAVALAMAGGRPENLPVLIAAVEAVAEQSFNIQGIQATTNSAAPWIIVNGPLAVTLGLNAGLNCLGQGTRANDTLGRALRLILQNIGGALPGEMDRATHGQPGKYSFCCAENEAANPWAPLHVERGFAADENVVTVVGAAGTLNLNSHSKEAADLLRVIATSMTYPTSNDFHFAGEPWLILSPEHAEVLARGGYDKAKLKEEIWALSKMPAARFARKDYDRAEHTRSTELGGFSPETLVPISPSPRDIGIIVAGGPGTHSVYVPTFGQTRAVSRRITP